MLLVLVDVVVAHQVAQSGVTSGKSGVGMAAVLCKIKPFVSVKTLMTVNIGRNGLQLVCHQSRRGWCCEIIALGIQPTGQP